MPKNNILKQLERLHKEREGSIINNTDIKEDTANTNEDVSNKKEDNNIKYLKSVHKAANNIGQDTDMSFTEKEIENYINGFNIDINKVMQLDNKEKMKYAPNNVAKQIIKLKTKELYDKKMQQIEDDMKKEYQDKLAQEREKIEAERKAKEKAIRQKEEEIRLKKERLEKERLEKERLEKERLEKERLEKERLEKERLEKERLEKERLEKERLEKERLEKERLEKERLEKERLEKERLEKERLEKERLEKEKETLKTKKETKNKTPNKNTVEIELINQDADNIEEELRLEYERKKKELEKQIETDFQRELEERRKQLLLEKEEEERLEKERQRLLREKEEREEQERLAKIESERRKKEEEEELTRKKKEEEELKKRKEKAKALESIFERPDDGDLSSMFSRDSGKSSVLADALSSNNKRGDITKVIKKNSKESHNNLNTNNKEDKSIEKQRAKLPNRRKKKVKKESKEMFINALDDSKKIDIDLDLKIDTNIDIEDELIENIKQYSHDVYVQYFKAFDWIINDKYSDKKRSLLTKENNTVPIIILKDNKEDAFVYGVYKGLESISETDNLSINKQLSEIRKVSKRLSINKSLEGVVDKESNVIRAEDLDLIGKKGKVEEVVYKEIDMSSVNREITESVSEEDEKYNNYYKNKEPVDINDRYELRGGTRYLLLLVGAPIGFIMVMYLLLVQTFKLP